MVTSLAVLPACTRMLPVSLFITTVGAVETVKWRVSVWVLVLPVKLFPITAKNVPTAPVNTTIRITANTIQGHGLCLRGGGP